MPSGRNVWSYSTQEEWEACLEEMCSLVLEAGLPWCELYTPWNIPDWKEWAEAKALPVLISHDFNRRKRRPENMPDSLTFIYHNSLDRIINFDLRFRGEVKVTLACRVKEDLVKQYSYETTGEFFTVLDEALEFVVSELPRWMAIPPF